MMKRLCVFCGSSAGARPQYSQAAGELGLLLARRGIALVYGGGNVGLMGDIARAVMQAGGEVIGVIPRHLAARDVANRAVSDLRVVETMHERKALMADLADGFAALPGGLGTLEEIAEVLTWAQLGLHPKPCGLLNTSGYYDPLCAFLNHMHAEEFVDAEHRQMVIVESEPAALLDRFESYRPPTGDKAVWALQRQHK